MLVQAGTFQQNPMAYLVHETSHRPQQSLLASQSGLATSKATK